MLNYYISNLISYKKRKGGDILIDVNKLKGAIVSAGKTQNEVAKELGITPKTFSLKLKKGVFGSDEIEVMIDYLSIGDPLSIFFAKNVT